MVSFLAEKDSHKKGIMGMGFWVWLVCYLKCTRMICLSLLKGVTIEDICKEIRALDASKATQSDDIPTKIIKNNSGSFSRFFQGNFDNAIEISTF